MEVFTPSPQELPALCLLITWTSSSGFICLPMAPAILLPITLNRASDSLVAARFCLSICSCRGLKSREEGIIRTFQPNVASRGLQASHCDKKTWALASPGWAEEQKSNWQKWGQWAQRTWSCGSCCGLLPFGGHTLLGVRRRGLQMSARNRCVRISSLKLEHAPLVSWLL